LHSCPRERHSGFGVFPQNAEELGIHFPDYLETVTGIGVEDLYYGYPRDHEPRRLIDNAYARSRARGFVTVRSLGLLIINGGHEPDWKGVVICWMCKQTWPRSRRRDPMER
jgi:hypothetical protein